MEWRVPGSPLTLVSPKPLNLRRLEHEKRRKEIKESWHRAQRKLVPRVGHGGWEGPGQPARACAVLWYAPR